MVNAITASPGYVAPKKPLAEVKALDGLRSLRPIDVFRGLAYATRIHYVHRDVYEMYSMWAWIRYLGLFDRDAGDNLVLSQEARRVRGNQRRVASEELGIGFAKTFGEDWLVGSHGSGAVTFVDVDVVPDGSYLPFAGGRQAVRRVATKRPDYFMIHTDPISGRSRVRVLESKGTSNFGNQAKQLASAVHQLEGVEVNGAAPTGLAVSAGIADVGAVRVLSVDPPSDDGEDPVYDVRSPADDVDEARLPPGERRPSNGVFEASLARLADYAGSTYAAVGWAPEHMRERLTSRPDENVVSSETPAGPSVGRRAVFQVGGRSVAVFAGITEELHAALASLDREAVLAAQADLAGTYLSRRAAAEEVGDGRVASVGPDGTILDIRIQG